MSYPKTLGRRFSMRAKPITEATLLFLFLLVIFAIAGGLES